MNNYKAPCAEKIELDIVNILMTSTEEGEDQLPINPRNITPNETTGTTPV